MVKKPAVHSKPSAAHGLVRVLCFALFGTTGMASIGIAILAPPVAGYYADRALLQAQQHRFRQLQDLYHQREELLNNTEHPAVVERAAIGNLHYQPVRATSADVVPLPTVWPELKDALTCIDQLPPCRPPSILQHYADALSAKPLSRIIILAIGVGLILVSLACFNPPR